MRETATTTATATADEPSKPVVTLSGPQELLWVTSADGARWAAGMRARDALAARDRREPRFVRDAVTGACVAVETLADGAHAVYRVRDDDTLYLRSARPFTETRALAAPHALHTRETDGHLGGKRYSQRFARRLAYALPRDVAEAQRLRREWWDDPYVVQGLARHMSHERLACALMRLARQWPVTRIECGVVVDELVAGVRINVRIRRRYDRSWIASCENEARRIVGARYYPRSARDEDSERASGELKSA